MNYEYTLQLLISKMCQPWISFNFCFNSNYKLKQVVLGINRMVGGVVSIWWLTYPLWFWILKLTFIDFDYVSITLRILLHLFYNDFCWTSINPNWQCISDGPWKCNSHKPQSDNWYSLSSSINNYSFASHIPIKWTIQ